MIEHQKGRVVAKHTRHCVVIQPNVEATFPVPEVFKEVISGQWVIDCISNGKVVESRPYRISQKKANPGSPVQSPFVPKAQNSSGASSTKKRPLEEFIVEPTKRVKYDSAKSREAFLKKTWDGLLELGHSPAVVAYALDTFCGNSSLAAKFLSKEKPVTTTPWSAVDDSVLDSTDTELVQKYGLDLIHDRRCYLASEKMSRKIT